MSQVWRRRMLVGLCWYMAVTCLAFGVLKFYPEGVLGWPSYFDRFEAWGFPRWFSIVVGAGEVFSGVTLLLPRRRFLGAGVFFITLVGATVTHIINDHALAESISAPIHLVLSGIIVLAFWPADWREPLALSRGAGTSGQGIPQGERPWHR
jgi:uncharacterized membrane protein YphA (DoxX/SURF4 family)